jgi:hypothetical protein
VAVTTEYSGKKTWVVPRVRRSALRQKGVQLDLPTRAQLQKGHVRGWTPEGNDNDDRLLIFLPVFFLRFVKSIRFNSHYFFPWWRHHSSHLDHTAHQA